MIQRGVLIIITGRYNRILAGRRLTAYMAGWHALPGERIEPGEAPTAAAKRKLLETTGIAADRLAFDGVVEEYRLNGTGQPGVFSYFVFTAALRPGAEVQNPEPDKCAGWEWLIRRQLKLLIPAHRAAIDVYRTGLVEIGYPTNSGSL